MHSNYLMTALAVVFLLSIETFAQTKKIDLDDLTIKGELHSDDRLLILSRQKNQLKDYVKLRKSYREEMLQELPVEKPILGFREQKK